MTKLIRFDWAMKNLLRNKANFDVLEGFLSTLLDQSIKVDSILESEGNKEHAQDKYNRVDLLVKTGAGEHIIIEVQCDHEWDYFSRILYGTSKAVTEYMVEGAPYCNIRKVIAVSIVFFNLGEGKDYLYKGTTTFHGMHYNDILELSSSEREMYNQNSSTVRLKTPEAIFPEYYIIKVNKYNERIANKKIDEWIYMFKTGEIKKSFTAPGIQIAAKKLDLLQLNEEERKVYARYKESLHDEASWAFEQRVLREKERAEGKAEGLMEGEAKGEKKVIRKMIENMVKEGCSLAMISSVTGLATTEIKTIIPEHNTLQPESF